MAVLSVLAQERNARFVPRWYAEDLPAGTGKTPKRFRPRDDEGPYVICDMHMPGATTYPAVAQVEIKCGNRQYTDGPVRVSAVSSADVNAMSAAAALSAHNSLPAPIVLGPGQEALFNLELDAGAFGAGAFLRVHGFHTDEEFARFIRENVGELYATMLTLSTTAAAVSDKDEHEFPSDVTIARMWEEQPTAVGAVSTMQVRIAGVDVIGSPESANGVLARHPADPRAFVGLVAPGKAKWNAAVQANAGGNLTQHLLLTGRRVYSEGLV